jgi:glycosyltransferase involved in cell wall biosynthesis
VPPDISVVVPTKDRPAGLAAVLRALAAQTLTPERFEVIVVDDGSTPAVQAAARVVRHERPRGPAAARNSGWRAARAPLVAFVDDDCVPVPGWLEAIAGAAGDGDAVVVQGPVGPPPGEEERVTPVAHTIEVGGPSRLFVSANIGYARALLERTGGFDERFRRACGEDVELGARATAAGAEVRWAPGAVVHHEVRAVGLLGTLRQTLKWTDAVRAVSMHPELRDLLVARVFWRPSHPLLLLAVAALATRRPLLALAAAAPYARHRAAGGARWLPVHLAIDATEIATAVVGSVRHRTLML